jgi:hypothetical protein
MAGFAAMSFKENRFMGLFAQIILTSAIRGA